MRGRAPSPEPGSDHRWIGRYLDGQEDAFREVDGWIRREIESRYPVVGEEIEDLCQIVHGKLLTNLQTGRFRHRSTLRTYVIGIVHYTAIDRLRALYREQLFRPLLASDEENAAAGNPYRSLLELEERDFLQQVLLHAPASCRALWRMAFIEELGYNEMARRLSIPSGTVKSRMWHCRRKALAILTRLVRVGFRRAGRAKK